jgi:hypothetical protein
LLKGSATVTANASDALSGIDTQSCDAIDTNTVGEKSVTCTATDKAGNTNNVLVTYSVYYKWIGFLQPINDTAHQVCSGCAKSVFKGGSTVPVKLQLEDANGNIVQATTAPVWLTPVKGSAMSASVDENVYTSSATTGTSYRWDSTMQQYIYNWSTSGYVTRYYWRIYAQLDDGEIVYVDIGLR